MTTFNNSCIMPATDVIMVNNSTPYGIQVRWDSAYLCKRCGGLIYYDINTKTENCINSGCQNYPNGMELYGAEEADLEFLNSQFAQIEKKIGQMVRTCDYRFLALSLLQMRRNIVTSFFTSGKMHINSFLVLNDILAFIPKYKSYGIRKDARTLGSIVQLYKQYSDHLKMAEDFKEGRYVLTRKPPQMIFKLKYYDVILEEIWPSYGLVDIRSMPNINNFRYHEVIQKLVSQQGTITTTEYGPLFDNLWPAAIGFQYLVKRNYATSLKYQYSVTPTDLANILSMIFSLKDNQVTTLPIMNLLMHFIKQPQRDKDFTDFIGILSGDTGKAPILFKINGNVMLDRRTMLLFFVLLHTQHIASSVIPSGQRAINLHKQQAGTEYETYLQAKLEGKGYRCMPRSTQITGRDYDQIAISESKREILLVEAKFQDPSPSSFSKHTLIKQEFTLDEHGLLPQAIRHQERYSLVFQNPLVFQATLGLNKKIADYSIKAYLVTKFTPLMNIYGNVSIMSERQFRTTILGVESQPS
jgi:hypothetical protein